MEALVARGEDGMPPQRSRHVFAVVLWALAAIYIIANVPLMLIERNMIHDAAVGAPLPLPLGAMFWRQFIIDFRSTAYGAAALASFGFIIDLLDAIRWAAIPPNERPAKGVQAKRVLTALEAARHWAASPITGPTTPTE